MKKHLVLYLDSPMQSWGYQSKYDNRSTFSCPTKSGIVGMACAAMGIERGDEKQIAEICKIEMVFYTISSPSPLVDYHITGGGYDKKENPQNIVKNANGGIGSTVVSKREYLTDAKFAIVMSGEDEKILKIGKAIQNPKWGIWFGRKCCIPSEPIFQNIFETFENAEKMVKSLGQDKNIRKQKTVSIKEAEDIIMDTPINFSSRKFVQRGISTTFI